MKVVKQGVEHVQIKMFEYLFSHISVGAGRFRCLLIIGRALLIMLETESIRRSPHSMQALLGNRGKQKFELGKMIFALVDIQPEILIFFLSGGLTSKFPGALMECSAKEVLTRSGICRQMTQNFW